MDQPVISPAEATLIPMDMKSAGEIFRSAWATYKAGFTKFVGLQLFAFLGMLPLILTIFISSFIVTTNVNGSVIKVILGALGIVFLIVGAYINLTCQVSTCLFLKNFVIEKTIIDLFKDGSSYVGRFFWVSILTGLIVMLGIIALIIPGIIFAIYYSFSTWSLVYEEKRGMDALRRSKELVKNYWWAVCYRCIYIAFFYFLISLVLSIPYLFFQEKSTQGQIWNFCIQFVKYVIAPIGIIYSFYIFKDLLRIKGSATSN